MLKGFSAQDDAENRQNSKPDALADKPVRVDWCDDLDPKKALEDEVSRQNTDEGPYDTSQNHPEKIRNSFPEKETGQNSDTERQNQRQKWN